MPPTACWTTLTTNSFSMSADPVMARPQSNQESEAYVQPSLVAVITVDFYINEESWWDLVHSCIFEWVTAQKPRGNDDLRAVLLAGADMGCDTGVTSI